jgi:hypothetical protein
MNMGKCYFQNSPEWGGRTRRESWRAAWKAAAENDKAQLIRDPTNRLLRLLSKSQGPV